MIAGVVAGVVAVRREGEQGEVKRDVRVGRGVEGGGVTGVVKTQGRLTLLFD